MTTRQWLALMIGLWACLITSQVALDGLPRVIATVCVFLGFLGSSVERWHNRKQLRLALHSARMASLRQARGVANVPAGSYVHHIDGDPYNNDPANLTIVESPDAP